MLPALVMSVLLPPLTLPVAIEKLIGAEIEADKPARAGAGRVRDVDVAARAGEERPADRGADRCR